MVLILNVPNKNAADDPLFLFYFYFYLSKKIRLDVSCNMKYQVLFSMENNEKVIMNVVVISAFKGLYWHYGEYTLYHFFIPKINMKINQLYKKYLFVTSQQTRNVIVTFSIGFKLVTLNLTFGKRLANVYVLCRHIFDV